MKISKTAILLFGMVIGMLASTSTVQASIKYFSTTVIVSGSGSVSCPSGSRLTGGGVEQLPTNRFSSLSSYEYSLTGSFPTSNGWKATAVLTQGTYSSNTGWRFSTRSYSPKVYAICAK
jgi:hypothetical protein